MRLMTMAMVGCLAFGLGGCGDDDPASDGATPSEDDDAGPTGDDDSADDDSADDDSADDDSADDDSADDDAPPLDMEAMAIAGMVSLLPGDAEAYPAGGAEIRALVDGDERAATTADSEGRYDLGVPVSEGETLVLEFTHDDASPLFRTIAAGPASALNVQALLRLSETFECEGGTCALEGSKLAVSGLAEGVTGTGQVFDPNTERDAFPGDFSDDAGNLLVSGVFASIELEDENGMPLTELDEPVRLRMQIPEESFPLIVDIDDTNDVIDVPLYAFDETAGEWVRDGAGWLEDAASEPVPAAELGDIRSGAYDGVLFASGDVQHFSYWNVDWPIESHGCVQARIVDAEGEPAVGAVVSVTGVTYTGTSRPQTVGEDGTFCVDVMRSEGADEDVDQDGVEGETQSVNVRVQLGSGLYGGGRHDLPVAAASCGGDCLDLGEITLDAENELQPSICTLSGVVEQADGTPVEGAFLFGDDPALEEEVLTSVCGEALTECDLFATTDAEGSFTMRVAMLDMASLTAVWSGTDADVVQTRFGTATLLECPEDDVRLRLDQGYDQYTLVVTVEGDVITWAPELAITALLVVREGYPVWQLAADDGEGFTGPVTHGTVPEGASQFFPLDGSAPEALESGDEIQVIANGLATGAIVTLGNGTLVVP